MAAARSTFAVFGVNSPSPPSRRTDSPTVSTARLAPSKMPLAVKPTGLTSPLLTSLLLADDVSSPPVGPADKKMRQCKSPYLHTSCGALHAHPAHFWRKMSAIHVAPEPAHLLQGLDVRVRAASIIALCSASAASALLVSSSARPTESGNIEGDMFAKMPMCRSSWIPSSSGISLKVRYFITRRNGGWHENESDGTRHKETSNF
jgi:hypothetical protein